jgi:iron complex outermembrane receptor protein/hemoglobin/transferrin/lactoferrin receptor protein
MIRTIKLFPCAAALLCLIFLSIFEVQAQQNQSELTRIEGIVTDQQNQPLPGVNVTFPELNRGTYTQSDGSYRISDLPSGTYTLVFSFVGYASQNKEVHIEKNTTAELNISLNPQLLQSETITVTGTPYASDPLTTPADVDVLTGDAKFSQQQASLGGSLDELAGVSTISTGSQMGKPVIRGLSGNRVRVLDDGTAMDFQQYGVRHGPNVDPFTSERIEVVRGAASVQYGSDALGGAVNVISNSIPDALNQPSFIDGQILGAFASNNNELTGGIHLDGASGGFGFTGTLVKRSSGNIHTGDSQTFAESGVSSDPKFAGELDNTDYDQLNGSLGVGYQGDFGKISAEYTRWKNEHNFLLPNGKGLGQNLENNVLQLKGNLPLGNNFILKPQFSYNQNLRQSNPGGANALPREDLPDEGDAFLDILLKSYTSKVEMSHPAAGPFSGTLGVEYKVQDQNSRGTGEPLVPSGSINNFGAFVFEKAELGAFTLSIGARMDIRSQEAEANEELSLPDTQADETAGVLDQQYTEFSGSVGGTYQFTEHFAVAGNISRGFRAPSFFNLHADGKHGGVAAYQIGDPALDPERSLNTDLSLRWRSSNLTAKVTGYRNAISNYIFLVNTGEFAGEGEGAPPILRSTQGDARLLGMDASAQAQVLPWLQLDGTFEIVKGENVDENIENVDDLPLLPATKISGGVKLMQQEMGMLQNPYLQFNVEHVFEKKAAGRYEPFWQFGPAFPFGRASTDAYTLLNISTGFDLDAWNRSVSVSIQAHNLLDTSYRNFLDTYKGYALSPGRDIRVRFKVPFGIL